MCDLYKLTKEELIQIIQSKDNKINELSVQTDWYQAQIKQLQKLIFGRKSEKSEKSVNEEQLSLFDEIEVESTPLKVEPELETIVYQRKKKKKKKAMDLSMFDKEEIHYELDESERICPKCGSPLRETGTNVRKELVFIPAKFKVIEHIQHVYACNTCDKSNDPTFVKAEMKPSVIYKSVASAELLASIINDKFYKALPLYRQEVSFKQNGLNLTRQTMANWMIKLYDLYFKTINEHMHNELIKMDYLLGDETTILCLEERRIARKEKSYMWVMTNGRSESKNIVYYHYEGNRRKDTAVKLFKGFKGILQSDGYAAYDSVSDVTNAACFAHCRRYYVKAVESLPKDTDKQSTKSQYLLNLINKLFMIERDLDIEKMSYDEIREIRQEKSKPILDEFFKEAEQAAKHPNISKYLEKALTYTNNHKKELSEFINDGRIEISTNKVERAIRPFTIGRKNFLFMNTINGANASAGIYSVVETAKANNLKTYDYLVYLLNQVTVIDIEDSNQLEKIMPWSKELPKELYLTKKS